jgi:hypothetical protein
VVGARRELERDDPCEITTERRAGDREVKLCDAVVLEVVALGRRVVDEKRDRVACQPSSVNQIVR